MSFDPEKEILSITLTQTQEVNKAQLLHFFEMELPIQVTDSNGIIHDSVAIFKAGDSKSASVSFQKFTGTPVKVIVDPAYTFLFSLSFNPGQDILFGVLKDETVAIPHRVWAIKELVKLGNVASYLALKQTLCKKDTFYGLQIEAARAAKATKTFFHVPSTPYHFSDVCSVLTRSSPL